MKRVPRVVEHPTAMKMYPILSSPIADTNFGVTKLMTKLTSQFNTVATLTDLSCIISAMYNHVIGPDENSKHAIKTITKITVG